MSEVSLNGVLTEENDLLTNALLFEKRWNTQVSVADALAKVDELVEEIKTIIPSEVVDIDLLDEVLNLLYSDFMFSSTCQQIPDSVLLSPSYAIYFRTGDDITLAIVFQSVLSKLGFEVEIIEFDNSIQLRVQIHSGEFFIIEPTSGLQERFIKSEDNDDVMTPVEYEAKSNDELLLILLNYQKIAFIDEDLFAQALCCVDMLMQVAPDDPYERRDRGFLLQQLDCFKVACDDYEFFLEQCPKDPAADILQIQLEEMKFKIGVLH